MGERSFAEIFSEELTKMTSKTSTKASPRADFHPTAGDAGESPRENYQKVFELHQLQLLKNNFNLNHSSLINKQKKNPYFIDPQARSKREKPNLRPKGITHKLNKAQQDAVAFFIDNLEILLEDFTQNELKKAFKKLCFKFHPDHGKSGSKGFIELKAHYECLNKIFTGKI